MINQQFYDHKEAILLKNFEQIEESLQLARGIYNGKIAPASLKLSFDRYLKFIAVYEMKCNGCESIYVGQTRELSTTRLSKHQKRNSKVGQHLAEYSGFSNDNE